MKSNSHQIKQIWLVLFLSIPIFYTGINAQDYLEVSDLKVEYKTNPIGIGEKIPRLSWIIKSNKENTYQTKYEIAYASDRADFENRGRYKTLIKETDQSAHIEFNEKKLNSREKVFWKVRVWDNYDRVSQWSSLGYWEMGLLEPEDWKAELIQGEISEKTDVSEPAQYFRKEFSLSKAIKSARLYITSHGIYEASINGIKVGDQVFTPGWTSYNKRLQYQTYDITGLLKKKDNTIGVILGDGWYRGYLAWNDNRNVYGDKLAIFAQIEIEFNDGSRRIITSDETWKATNKGPIRKSDIYMGEEYDAKMELTGWNEAGYDDTNWDETKSADFDKSILISSEGPPVRKIQEIVPIEIISGENGKYIFDMGQNMVGWIRLKVKGDRGETIILRHAEVLDKNGNFYTENLREAKQEINYTLKGGGEEIFEPHFTFQGFRYVEVSNYPGVPNLESLTGIVIHSDMNPTGNFECSDPLINQLQKNIQWGLKGNFLDVPTDCPQRDERLGWTGDAQVFAPTACFNMDAAMFYTKWLKDLSADQGDDGKVGDVIPNILGDGGGHTGWADAAVVVPWTVYLKYGDKRVLQNQYASMEAWISYMYDRAGDDYIWDGDWHYGDWLSFDADNASYMGAYTETDLIATAYFSYSSKLLSKISSILNKEKEAKYYSQLSTNIDKAFNDEFLTPNGRLVSNTQTAYTLALAFDIIPDSISASTSEYLARNVNRFKHITTGFLGTPLISRTLTENGHLDLAYLLLNRKEYPSWLYPVTMGATTIWERWDGIKPDTTFQNKGMNSFNHYAYGAIGDWLYSTVAGLRLDECNPGYKNIIIFPQPGGEITSAKASLKSQYGLIESDWEIVDGIMNLKVIIPVNTRAAIKVCPSNTEGITINGAKAESSNFEKVGQNLYQINLGSGTYNFKYKIKN